MIGCAENGGRSYDAEGRRVETNYGSWQMDHIYDIYGNLTAEWQYNPDSYIWFSYQNLFLGTRPLAVYANGTTYWYHQDHLGSNRLLTDLNGNPYEWIDYLPFGEMSYRAGGCCTNIHFTGKWHDWESGLDNFDARELGTNQGRFTSPDGVSFSSPLNPQSWNLYSYVFNNPLSLTDPSGHFPQQHPLIEVGWECTPSTVGCNGSVQAISYSLFGNLGIIASNSDDDGGILSGISKWFSNLFKSQAQIEKEEGEEAYRDGEWLKDHGIDVNSPTVRNADGSPLSNKQVIDLYNAVQKGQTSWNGTTIQYAIMLGAGGTKLQNSKTLWQRSTERIDVENPAPGKRPGSLHYQNGGRGATRFEYNIETKSFDGLSKTANRNLLNRPGVADAIAKGLKYLGVNQ